MILGSATFEIAINRKFRDKFKPRNGAGWDDFNNTFENVTLNVEQLIAEIRSGHAITSPHKHEHVLLGHDADGSEERSAYRHSVNWQQSQHLGLDFDTEDERSTLRNVADDKFVAGHGAFIYTTSSHKPSAPRCRAIFITDQPITDPGHYANAAAALHWKFAGVADSSCKDVARLFYGSTDCEVLRPGRMLPINVLDELIAEWQAWEAGQYTQRPAYNFDNATPDLDKVRDALRAIPRKMDYHEWLKVLMAVHSEFPGTDGIAACEEWSPGYSGEIERKFKSFKRSKGKAVGIGSMFHIAKQNGWQPPKRSRTTKPTGQAAAPSATATVEDGMPHNTDMGNALRMHALHGGRVMYVPHFGKWFVWADTHWREDDNFTILALAKKAVLNMYIEAATVADDDARKDLLKWIRQSESRQRLENMIALLRAEPGIAVQPAILDRETMFLPCRNGTVDLRTGDLLPADPAHRFTKCLDVDYDPGAECPLWDRFLCRIMDGDLELVSFIQRLVGHALTGDAGGKYIAFLWGPKGNNGKSTLAETIMRLLGPYAIKSPSEMVMAKSYRGGVPNDIARLRGVRFTVTNEVDEGMTLSESVVKDLTGKDTLTARFMREEFFDFAPTHKLWIYGNHKPEIRGTDPAIWDRVKLIPFEVEIPERERDPHLQDKLAQELPGILAWAVRGCLAWQKMGINAPEGVKAATGEYRAEQDMIGQFVDDCCDLDRSYEVASGSIYQAYEAWCKGMGIKAESGTKFGSELGRRGFKSARTASLRMRQGLQLNSHGRQLLPDTGSKHWTDNG